MSNDKRFTDKWLGGDTNAVMTELARQLGGEDQLRRFQKGRITIVPQEVRKTLFTRRGFRIQRDIESKTRDPHRNYCLEQPTFGGGRGYVAAADRFQDATGNLPARIFGGFNISQFCKEAERLVCLLGQNAQTKNILNGVWLPICLPKLELEDIREATGFYIQAVIQAYKNAFPNRKFRNRLDRDADVCLWPETGQEELIKLMRQGPVIGLYFPSALQGFSVHAQIEQMEDLPQGFYLSGLDTFIAMAMYIETMARDYHTPNMNLSGLYIPCLEKDRLLNTFVRQSLLFTTSEDDLSLSTCTELAVADSMVSGGLFFCKP